MEFNKTSTSSVVLLSNSMSKAVDFAYEFLSYWLSQTNDIYRFEMQKNYSCKDFLEHFLNQKERKDDKIKGLLKPQL